MKNNFVWNTHAELEAYLLILWGKINALYYGDQLDFHKKMSKEELKDFCWNTYDFIIDLYYNGNHKNALRDKGYLQITNRKVSFAGRCRKYGPIDGNGPYEIQISYQYYEDWGFIQMLDTLLHEIGHLTYWEHDEDFWNEGKRIGYGLEPSGIKPRPAKYRIYCETCDYEYYYRSRPNTYYRCGRCHPDWDSWWALGNKKPWMKIEKNTDPNKLV